MARDPLLISRRLEVLYICPAHLLAHGPPKLAKLAKLEISEFKCILLTKCV